MSKYRESLPQSRGQICITDGGLETDFVFNRDTDLPEFASYDLLRTPEGYAALYDYYKHYAKLALAYQAALILETPTWRANQDWGTKIGDSPESLKRFNLEAVRLVEEIRDHFETDQSPIVISGCIGPRGDGYNPAFFMTASEAKNYHSAQVATFAETAVDMIGALTLNYVEEAIGIALAAKQHGLPVCISFTVETDGKLPTGASLDEAITMVDEATDNYPTYFMINCAHPTHFEQSLDNPVCKSRLRGLRANASSCSHAELDEAKQLDDGNPVELGHQFAGLMTKFPQINVIGGCCGTDHRHIEEIAINCLGND